MSHFTGTDPIPGDRASVDAIEQVIVPRAKDLGGFEVRRALPAVGRQMVGPFIFWDQMGPALFDPGQGIDVRPHPHIGLSTLTYLFEGEMMHRDSLGSALAIKPGEVNLMTAGRGIVHSERTAPETRARGQRMFGIQSWLALPKAEEERAPSFTHLGADDFPLIEDRGVRVRLIAGSLFGATAPLTTPGNPLYADVMLAAGSRLPIDPSAEERALYTVEGEILIRGDRFPPGQLLVIRPGDTVTVEAAGAARFMVLGGDAADGPRHIWWNFVSSSKARIEQAKDEWRTGRFDIVPGDAEDFIPLPG
jgi:hypothetical protein